MIKSIQPEKARMMKGEKVLKRENIHLIQIGCKKFVEVNRHIRR